MSAQSTEHAVSDGVRPVDPVSVAAAPPPHAGGDPTILGLPIFAAGSLVLGFTLVGFVSAGAGGAPLAIIFAGTGLGLLIATIWAISLGQTMVACVFGLFAGFWLSYAALVLGLNHAWYAIPAADVEHTVAEFQITWAIIFAALTIASVRLPSGFTLVFGLVVLALVLLVIGTLGTSTFWGHAAGVVTFAFAAVGLYLFMAAASVASGGPAYPIGKPLVE
jgi:uncharacterized protein